MIDYNQRLDNLKKRRFDDELQKAVLSESFEKSKYGNTMKYVLESMMPIDKNYTENTLFASGRVQKQIKEGLAKLGYEIEFEHQGSVPLNTHIRTYSDIDLLVVNQQSFSLEPPLTPSSAYQGNPVEDLKSRREEVLNILKTTFTACSLDNKNSKALSISGGSLRRKIDIIFCSWLYSETWEQYKLDYLKGINFLDRDNHRRIKDYPFLHIKRINDRDILVDGNEKRLIRLLKNLKADSDRKIKLSSFEITCVVHTMSDVQLKQPIQKALRLLEYCSVHMNNLITDEGYRDNRFSPNGKEKLNFNLAEIKKLKEELDEIISDIYSEIKPLYESFEKAEVQYL